MWFLIKDQGAWIIGAIIVIAFTTSVRVVLDTRSPSKTAAYLLLIILFPLVGSILYFLVGVNYRKRKIYSKKLTRNEYLFQKVKDRIHRDTGLVREKFARLTQKHDELIDLLMGESLCPLTENNVTLLINGEQKFPALLEALEKARHFIHIEYYIFDEDHTGRQVRDVLIRKSREGVRVRIIFDDFGSHGLWNSFVDEFRENGIEIYPFYRIHFVLLANRINYRDHRKVVIIDGTVGFIGGINLADRYSNTFAGNLFWRDTHLKIEGTAVLTLQYHFLSNWNFCSDQNLEMSPELFPESVPGDAGEDLVQIVTSGPDSPRPSIMLSYFAAIALARKSVYITTPYFIPNESIINAIKKAAFSGKDVRLLLPRQSDSAFVDAASRFYFQDMMEAGVKIYLYERGFIHAKTMVVDDTLSIVGTANMDLRSFELNFEINAVVYSDIINRELKAIFYLDLEDSRLITMEEIRQQSMFRAYLNGMARILAPLL